jgi:glyceraldehyde 3-phosphate dehydrogenase
MKFAINGFGRIGRSIFRALHERDDLVANCLVINAGVGDIETYYHLLKHDSIHGHFAAKLEGNKIVTDKLAVEVIFKMEPKEIDWSKYGVEVVLESTGAFTKKELAQKHCDAGAKMVIVTAPCENADATIVYGINHLSLSGDHKVISMGSCTTNCLAPVAKFLNDEIGLEKGFMTTIHSYTNDQNLVDAVHKDKRRARAAALSMIPSTTGAAKALGLVLPELAGKLDGVAIRVPTPNVSLVDLKFTSRRPTTAAEVNDIIIRAAKTIPSVLSYTDEELVSIDFNHNPASSIFDTTQTRVVEGNFVRVCSWYDNEWGFSNRVLDVLKYLAK